MPLERPRMLKRSVEVIVDSGIFGKTAIQESLALPEKELEQLAGLETGFFRSGEIVPLVTPKSSDGLNIVDLESGKVLAFRPKEST